MGGQYAFGYPGKRFPEVLRVTGKIHPGFTLGVQVGLGLKAEFGLRQAPFL